MQEVLRRLEEAQAGGLDTPYFTYQMQAHAAFLEAAVAGIRKVAGGHAESVKVKPGRSVVWLEYTGQIQSDLDLVWIASIVDLDDDTVKLFTDGDLAGRKLPDRQVVLKTGVMTPQAVVDQFVEVFGR